MIPCNDGFFVYRFQVIESLSLLPYQPTPMHSVLCPCLPWVWQPGWGLVLLGVELPVLGALPFLKEKWGCPQGKEEAVRVSDLPTPRDIHARDPAWERPWKLLLGGATMILQPQLSHVGASHNSVLSPATIFQVWLSGGAYEQLRTAWGFGYAAQKAPALTLPKVGSWELFAECAGKTRGWERRKGLGHKKKVARIGRESRVVCHKHQSLHQGRTGLAGGWELGDGGRPRAASVRFAGMEYRGAGQSLASRIK